MVLQTTILATVLIISVIGLIGGIVGIIAYMRSLHVRELLQYFEWLKKNGLI